MTKSLPLALLIAAGLLSSAATARAYTTYGNRAVNGTIYNLSRGADLTYANLSYADLTSADLYSADLSNSYLYSTNLSSANLNGANLSYANLSSANLSSANLILANLSSANLSGTNLTSADLTYANLSYADLTSATVSYSDWTDFSTNSGALGLGSYSYDTSLINYANAPAVPEPSTYGLIGIAALGVAFAARRKKQKSV